MRKSNAKRRESIKARDDEVHQLYNDIIQELGELAKVVSKTYIYERIRGKTKLSIRSISYIINHTE